jgi:hypothetical protein
MSRLAADRQDVARRTLNDQPQHLTCEVHSMPGSSARTRPKRSARRPPNSTAPIPIAFMALNRRPI